VDSIRGFAHAAGFAAARRCLRFLVYIFIFIRQIYGSIYKKAKAQEKKAANGTHT